MFQIKLADLNQTKVFIILIIISSCSYILLPGAYFFRDFAIIFDGGLRISHGQIPYRDFFIPTGPIIYYLQGLFAWIFGPNTLSMQMHALVFSCIGLLAFFLYAQKHLNNIAALIFTFFLHFFLYAKLLNPWYDQTALIFYLIPQIILLNYINKSILNKTLVLMGISLCLSFFSKQDTGAIGFIFILIQLIIFSKKRLKYSIVFSSSFFLLSILLIAYFSSISDFFYWFNIGHGQHTSRISNILNYFTDKKIIYDFRIHAIIFTFVINIIYSKLFRYNLYESFILLGFCVFSITISKTSGQGIYSSLFFIPLIFIQIKNILSNCLNHESNNYNDKILITLVVWLFAAYSLKPAVNNSFIFRNYLHSYFNVSKYVKLKNSSFSGHLFEPEIINGIERIKKELQDNMQEPDSNYFLNMSSYTFMYSDLNIEPPRGMHLYYQMNVTLFDDDYEMFKQKLKIKPFKYILLQEMTSGSPPREFWSYISKLGYKKVISADTPKSGVDGKGRGARYSAILYKYSF